MGLNDPKNGICSTKKIMRSENWVERHGRAWGSAPKGRYYDGCIDQELICSLVFWVATLLHSITTTWDLIGYGFELDDTIIVFNRSDYQIYIYI